MTDNIVRKSQTGETGNRGEFGTHTRAEGDIALAKSPVKISVRLEAWDGNDDLVELESLEFDARTILDARDLNDIELSSNDDDGLYFEAVRLGIVKSHDGPFTVYLDDQSVADYVAARSEAGELDALTGRPRRSWAQLNRARETIQAEQKAVARKDFELSKEEITAFILDDYPTATEIHLWNVAEGENEDEDFRILSVTLANGDAHNLAGSSKYDHIGGDSAALAPFTEELRLQRADGAHWFGIAVE